MLVISLRVLGTGVRESPVGWTEGPSRCSSVLLLESSTGRLQMCPQFGFEDVDSSQFPMIGVFCLESQ